jgi:hypothetical protein
LYCAGKGLVFTRSSQRSGSIVSGTEGLVGKSG